MKRTTSSAIALGAAAILGAAVLLSGPAVAHESKDDDGQRTRSGMMGHMMDHEMMDHMMGRGMGGHNMMGRSMMGFPVSPCNVRADIDRDLSVKDITEMLNLRLQRWGNDRLKLGKVEAKDGDTIIAEIVTVDDSLVQRLAIDRDTGSQRRIK